MTAVMMASGTRGPVGKWAGTRAPRRAVRQDVAGGAWTGGMAPRSRTGARPRPGGQASELTRRGWIVVAGLALALAAGAFRAGAATADERYVPTRQVVVQSGDTLWSIASALADGGQDVQGVVTRLQRINGLRGSTLQVGDVLEVPRE